MRYDVSRYPNGQIIATGHACTYQYGGGYFALFNYYCPSGETHQQGMCMDACPVSPLADMTDHVANLYEDGTYNSTDRPDLAHLDQATQTGLACIQQKVAALNCYMTPRPTSGYRPAVYQAHILDVYDKWQQLQR